MIFDIQSFEELLRTVVREEISKAMEQKKEKLYSVDETCERLDVSPSTLSRMTKKGEIKATRLTGRPKYTEDEINRIILNKQG
jgi:excisionase family DNA binding protein